MYERFTTSQPIRRSSLLLLVLFILACCCGFLMHMSHTAASLINAISRSDQNDLIWTVFNKWQKAYQREYTTQDERLQRFKIFEQRFWRLKQLIDSGITYSVSLNQFADMTADDMKNMSGIKPPETLRNPVSLPLTPNGMPQSIDWRQKGAVSTVKNIGACGSSWAHTAIAAIEGLWAIHNGTLYNLSAQQLIDCSVNFGNEGCVGGLIDYAFSYVKAKGLERDEDYPYVQKDQPCKYDKDSVVVPKISGFVDIDGNNQDLLAQATSAQPITVQVDSSSDSFIAYSGGIYNDVECGTDASLSVTVVGYDFTGPTPYFIIKNNWGTQWGESGYMRLQKTSGIGPGICGIAEYPSYPTLHTDPQ